ncbi:hypothetical protein GCM10023094_09670 [Rhodococcus olei]|uniref:Uncharacterized protein n=1 Tax=Rhodococcus olei TaxID=2161675 RepID=A0ABP8NXU3_9NOCA
MRVQEVFPRTEGAAAWATAAGGLPEGALEHRGAADPGGQDRQQLGHVRIHPDSLSLGSLPSLGYMASTRALISAVLIGPPPAVGRVVVGVGYT